MNEQENPFCTQSQLGNVPVKFSPERTCIANKGQVQRKIVSNSCVNRNANRGIVIAVVVVSEWYSPWTIHYVTRLPASTPSLLPTTMNCSVKGRTDFWVLSQRYRCGSVPWFLVICLSELVFFNFPLPFRGRIIWSNTQQKQKQHKEESLRKNRTKSLVNSKAARLETGHTHCPTGWWLQTATAS